MLRATLLALALASVAAPAPPADSAPPVRTLVLILDAVPFATVEELLASRPADDPLFDGFAPPVPLISTFPSSTSVAMVGLLEPFELTRSPGYEARFFDWERRKVRGGRLISFFKIDFAWREFFDWSRKGVVRTALGGLRPVSVSAARAEKAVEAFFATDKDPYFVYLETTDLAAHMKGPQALEEVFLSIDSALEEARHRHPESPFRTVIFSDHGVAGDGTPLVNAKPAVRRAAREAGFRLAGRLRRPNDLVLIPFGLVSNLEAYAHPERTAAASSALVQAEGVDLCVYRAGDAMLVENRDGKARIERRQRPGGLAWRYLPDSGDPLGYRALAAELERAAGAELVSDERWLERTADHHYPDALYRIARAFELVDNPASVLCSLEPGYMYGMTTTEFLARASGSTVRWTHGALFREATLGFLLTDDERFATAGSLRFDRALLPLTMERSAALDESSDREAETAAAERQRDKMPEVFER